jgi:hypothetical protein
MISLHAELRADGACVRRDGDVERRRAPDEQP